jgi:hypothetical protein
MAQARAGPMMPFLETVEELASSLAHRGVRCSPRVAVVNPLIHRNPAQVYVEALHNYSIVLTNYLKLPHLGPARSSSFPPPLPQPRPYSIALPAPPPRDYHRLRAGTRG